MDSLKILDFWNFSGHRIFFRYCGRQLGKPNEQESSCSDHPVLPSTASQVHDPLLTPTKKCKSRKKRVVQTVTSTSGSVKSVPATPESEETVSVNSESAETVPVIPESVMSVPVTSQSVMSVPATPESAETVPVTPESAKSVLLTARLANITPVLPELAASTPEVVKHTLSSRQKRKKGKSHAVQAVPEHFQSPLQKKLFQFQSPLQKKLFQFLSPLQ